MNNSIDREYIALELTKITVSDKCFSEERVSEIYLHHLEKLYGVEDLKNIPILRAKLDDLTHENIKLREDIKNTINTRVEKKFNEIKDILYLGKGNMEEYIFNDIMRIINE